MSDTFTHPNDYEVLPRQYRIINRAGRRLAAVMMPYPSLDSGAACIGDEAYSEELVRVPAGQIDYMKGKCALCPLLVACREWGIAHEREFMYGGLTPAERARIRKQRGQVVVEPSAAHQYGMNDEYIQNRGAKGFAKAAAAKAEPVEDDGYAEDMPWVHPLG